MARVRASPLGAWSSIQTPQRIASLHIVSFFFLTPLYCVAVDTIPLVFIFFFNEKTDAEISCCSKQLDTLSLRIVLCAGGRPREACAPLLGRSPH